MARVNTHGDLFGKVVAAMVFMFGIAALAYVFLTAVHLFQSPVPGLDLPVSKGQAPPTGLNIGAALASLFSKLAILALMTLAASLIASKGIHLYQAAAVAHHPRLADPAATEIPTSPESTRPLS